MAASTVQDIIDRAMRAMGAIAAGKAASGNDAADGLRALQDTINDLPLLMDGQWADVFLTDASAYEAEDGERIFTNGYAATITLPATYTDDNGQTVATQDCARVQIIGADHDQAGVWVYTASKGSWARVDELAITDDSPFGKEDDSGLAALVAVSLAGEYGAEVSEITVNRAARCQSGFRARFYREVIVPCDDAYVRMSDLGNGDYETRFGE